MKIQFCKELQDGKLTLSCGRIVIFENYIDISKGLSRDHNDLLLSLASRYKLNKDEVISKAIRLYWDFLGKDSIIVSPVRKLDEEMYFQKKEFNDRLINNAL